MDIYAMRERRGLTIWLGVLFAAVILAAVALVVLKFDGAFSNDLRMTAQLPPDSAVAPINSPVHYRDVKVGKVVSAPRPDGHGHMVVDIELQPGRASQIPATVTAAVAPVSIFGNEYVNLVPTGPTGPVGLAAGAVIPAADTGSSPSLQATFTSLDQVLRAVNPAQLNAGLSGLSQALAGRGTELGHSLVSANTYLQQMLKLWPKLVADLKAFAPFATTLATSTPAFLDLLRNATVTSTTFNQLGTQFESLMSNGAQAANQTATLIGQTMATYGQAIDGGSTLLAALSQSPALISRILTGMASFGKQWSAAMDGSSVSVTAAPIEVSDPAQLALALVSGQNVVSRLEQAVSGLLVNPPTYTAADCPHYGRLRADCGGGK